ncbi:MAG: DapH/DapD/GlmU-related protein [Anaerolineales bacterium]
MQRTLLFLYPILSVVSQLIVALLLGLALFPSMLFIGWAWSAVGGLNAGAGGVLLFCLALGFAFILFGNTLLVLVILISRVFRIRATEKRAKVFSPTTIFYALYSLLLHVASSFYLPVLKSSYFNVWFYRRMGAKIGKGTLVATNRIWDCDLVEIGENCIIGGNASISAHYAQGARGRLRKVVIGNSVTVGANSSIMPGVVIEDNVVVGAHTLVPPGMHLKSGGIYLGVPAERVN